MTRRTPLLRNARLVAFVGLSFLGLASGLWWLAGPIAALHALPVLLLFAALCSGWYVGEELIVALRARRMRWPRRSVVHRGGPVRVRPALPRHARSLPRRGPPWLLSPT
jgi:hypothetical protein